LTSYIQAVIFAALGLRCVMNWTRDRDRRSGHLAVAAGLYGLQSAISAISGTVYDQYQIPPQMPPRWIGILTTVLLYLAIYAFLLFLSDFIPFPRWVHGLLIIATIVNVVLAVIERIDFRIDIRTGKQTPIPGVHNPIHFKTYLGYVLLYLALAFGALALAFLLYGFRTQGLARFRMLCIGAGFFLFFVVIGLLPRLIYGNQNPQTFRSFLNVLIYIALGSGPLLLLGFSPPRFIRSRFTDTSQPQVAR
jgi:hypothetical protein